MKNQESKFEVLRHVLYVLQQSKYIICHLKRQTCIVAVMVYELQRRYRSSIPIRRDVIYNCIWSGMRCCVSIKPLKLKLSPEAQHIWILCVAVFVPRCLKWFGRVVLWYFTSWVPQCWELCSYQTIKQKKRDYDKTVQIFIVCLMTEVMGNYTKWTQSPKRCFSHWTKKKKLKL